MAWGSDFNQTYRVYDTDDTYPFHNCRYYYFFSCASYTKRATVMGQLVPTTGQIKVHSPQFGVITEKYVEEGARVERGAKLFMISSERYQTDTGPVQAGISQHLLTRQEALVDELEKLKQVQVDERKTVNSKIITLDHDLKIVEMQIVNQQQRVALANNAADRYKHLSTQGYVSTDQLQQRQAELLSFRQNLHELNRDRSSLKQQKAENVNTISKLDALHNNQRSELQRALLRLKQEREENEARRALLITAPETGTATVVSAEIGQTVDSSRPLLSIVPINTQFEAELYAPSKFIGFSKAGDEVWIRYQAYSYQKFGQYHGVILSISRTAVPPHELSNLVGGVSSIGQSGEHLYRIRVQLTKQDVIAYGGSRPLHSGMLLEADLLQESRQLYEWVLEPLYSLTGKL